MPSLDVIDVPVPAMRGIQRLLRKRPGWRMRARWFSREHILQDIADSTSVGLIAAWYWPHGEQLRCLRDLGRPLVTLLDSEQIMGSAVVDNDDVAIGAQAARYLLARGHRCLAYCGIPDLQMSVRRWQGFREACAAAGREAVFIPEQEDTHQILATLPRPLAVLACTDGIASRLVEWFADAIPARMAVMGVDNAPMFCDFTPVPLSSVAPDLEAMGYRAAELLVDGLTHDEPPAGRHEIAPRGVVPRRSTECYAASSELVRKALRLILDAGPGAWNVASLAAHLACSRSTLQRRFLQELDRSPGTMIREHDLLCARQELLTSNAAIADIARRCGFANASAFTRAFRRFFKDSPSDVRMV